MSDLTFAASPFQRSLDALPIRSASLDLLDLEQVRQHLQRAQANGRYRGPADVLGYLEQRNCIARFEARTYATLTGLLCFGYDPQELFPHAVVDICHYRHQSVNARDLVHVLKGLGGTIFQQIAVVESYLFEHTFHLGLAHPATGQALTLYEYPPTVIKELTVNLIAHRDYTEYASVAQIMLFRDRIEWVNPGGLPPGVTPENMILVQHSRNPNLMRILYDSGHVDAFGQGVDTVFTTLRRERMAEPVFLHNNNTLSVSVYGRTVAAIVEQSGLRAELSPDQRLLFDIISRQDGGIAAADLRALMVGRADRTIQRDLKVLADLGLVVTSGATRSLRYRLVSNAGC